MVGGKWGHIMSREMGPGLPAWDVYTRGARFIALFNTGRAPAAWVARAKEGWIKLSRTRGEIRVGPFVKGGLPFDLPGDARVLVSVDWSRAPKGEAVSGTVEIEGAGARRT